MLDERNGTWNVMKRGYWKRSYQEVNISRGYSFDAVNLRPKLWASLRSCALNFPTETAADQSFIPTPASTPHFITQHFRDDNFSAWKTHYRAEYGFISIHQCTSRFGLIFCFCALHNTMKINNAHRQRKKTLFTSSTEKWAEKFPIKMLRSASSHYLALHIQFSITISGHTRPCRVDAFIWKNICVGVDSPSGIWRHDRKVFVWKWKTNQDHVCGEILIELLERIVKIGRKLRSGNQRPNRRRWCIELINFRT